MSTVLALRLEDATRAMIRARSDDVARPLHRGIRVNEAKWGAIDLLNTAMRSGLVALYASASRSRARALLAARRADTESTLLLLDEPTSSVDPATEARLYDNLFRALPDACVVSTIHRTHLLERFDVVLVCEGGRVRASAPHGLLHEARDHAGEPARGVVHVVAEDLDVVLEHLLPDGTNRHLRGEHAAPLEPAGE